MIRLYLFSIFLLTLSCNQYFKPTLVGESSPVLSATLLDSLMKEKDYFILRNGHRSYFMKDARVTNNKDTITSMLRATARRLQSRSVNESDGSPKSSTNGTEKRLVLREVHLYIADANITRRPNRLPLNSIQKIKIIEKEKPHASDIMGVGVMAALVSLIGFVGLILLSWLAE